MFRTSPSECNRVLIASADAGSRRTMAEIVKAADLRAVGFIRDAEQVAARTSISAPDILMLDLETLEEAQKHGFCPGKASRKEVLRVVVCGNAVPVQQAARLKQEGVQMVLDLSHPSGKTSDGLARLVLQGLAAAPCEAARAAASRPTVPVQATTRGQRRTLSPACVVVGSSTGGPVALMTLIKALPHDFPVPIAVVQHMPAGFTHLLAERLNAECALRVVEAEEGMLLLPGTVYIAPGGWHMALAGTAKSCQVALHLGDPENSCRPAVDVLFRSAAEVYGGHLHAVVLTGMGRDGCLGATRLYELGCRVTVQDAATSTVWGMPGAVAQAGIADDVLPIHDIAAHLLRSL